MFLSQINNLRLFLECKILACVDNDVIEEVRCCRPMTAYVLGCRLRVEVKIEPTGEWLWAEYDNMTVESENNKYTLHVTGYHGNAGDAFNDDHAVNWQSNGMPFSTPDVDNDENPKANCGRKYGWWYKKCSSSRLNGRSVWYSAPKKPPSTIKVSFSRMMMQCGVGNY